MSDNENNNINNGNNNTLNWTQNFGSRLIQSVELTAGGVVMNRWFTCKTCKQLVQGSDHSGECVGCIHKEFWSTFEVSEDNNQGYSNMVGNGGYDSTHRVNNKDNKRKRDPWDSGDKVRRELEQAKLEKGDTQGYLLSS